MSSKNTDAVSGTPFQDSIFALLRAWAESSNDQWSKLRLVLAVSRTPAQLINDPNSSPFNLTAPIVLGDLAADQVADLGRRHRLAWSRREIDRVMAAGMRFGCVLADAGYGSSAPFRQELTARNLAWAVGIPRHLKVYPVGVQLIWPVAARGRPRKRHVPDHLSIPAEHMLAGIKWRTLSWRTGTKGKLKARFAAVRVRTADGPPQRIWDKGQQHLPGDEAWLIGEQRVSGEKKYYLANLPAEADLRSLAATIKARWICEQAHQQLKEELGLDHFEGRSWHGLHRHALMTMIAYAFLQHRRLAKAKRGKKNQRTTASTKPASGPSRHRQYYASIAAAAMPTLPKMDRPRAA